MSLHGGQRLAIKSDIYPRQNDYFATHVEVHIAQCAKASIAACHMLVAAAGKRDKECFPSKHFDGLYKEFCVDCTFSLALPCVVILHYGHEGYHHIPFVVLAMKGIAMQQFDDNPRGLVYSRAASRFSLRSPCSQGGLWDNTRTTSGNSVRWMMSWTVPPTVDDKLYFVYVFVCS
ncbi:hypothetical protein CROQUDRAFT_717642 [Cronartium quercuum f. sp. fusiforme G11]|uniref:Uncharacterized protein n=1 Tax=Cronartium quercuum f. sp. fusiforme G11 TaxID=708437 RepID=A0A9P6T807_9BASI|nr:hypothetical protein CROQUDRAFT_717642 [Cronartium quercuum f. sp. fusiforme G11]